MGIPIGLNHTKLHLGVGTGDILTYVDQVRNRWLFDRFHLFFDNFFSSMVLFEQFAKDISETGTTGSNRIVKNSFKSAAEMKKNRTKY